MFAVAALTSVASALSAQQSQSQSQTASLQTPRPPTRDEAPIALLVDLSTGQTLFARAATRRFIPASVTKVMTAYVAFEKLEKRELDLNRRIQMTQPIFDEWYRTGSTMFIPRDAAPTVDELLHGITTVSGNDASVLLATGAAGSVANWAKEMNGAARELGMGGSHFATPNGYPDDGRTFVTGRDLVKLSSAMIVRHNQKYRHFFGVRGFNYNGISQTNHDPLTGHVLGADGIKTGFTNEAGFNVLGSAQRANQRLVMVLAGSDRGRIRDGAARSFMEWGFENFERRLLFVKGEPIAAARIQNAKTDRLQLVAARSVFANVPRHGNDAIAMKVTYEGPLRAPIEAGEHVADLQISVSGFSTFDVPLYARDAVGEASFTQRLSNGFRALFSV